MESDGLKQLQRRFTCQDAMINTKYHCLIKHNTQQVQEQYTNEFLNVTYFLRLAQYSTQHIVQITEYYECSDTEIPSVVEVKKEN